MYCIADWEANFEVDSNGRRWKPGSQFFVGPLPYVRCPARRDWPVRLLHIERKLGEQVYMVLGMFEKLISIVGAEPRALREGGVIRNCRQEPASLTDIAMMLLVSEERAKWALDVLCSPTIEWVVVQPDSGLPGEGDDPAQPAESSGSPQDPATLADNSEPSGNSRKTASVEVISDHDIFKSSNLSDTLKGPRIVSILDLDSKAKEEGLDLRPDTKCYQILTGILRPQTAEDFTGLANLVLWLSTLARASPDIYNDAIHTAKDCVNGRNPLAVFMSRLKKEMDYKPGRRSRAKDG